MFQPVEPLRGHFAAFALECERKRLPLRMRFRAGQRRNVNELKGQILFFRGERITLQGLEVFCFRCCQVHRRPKKRAIRIIIAPLGSAMFERPPYPS